jgi:hypothetical protein
MLLIFRAFVRLQLISAYGSFRQTQKARMFSYPRSEAVGSPQKSISLRPRLARTLADLFATLAFEISDVSEQCRIAANAMIYTMLVYFSSFFYPFVLIITLPFIVFQFSC